MPDARTFHRLCVTAIGLTALLFGGCSRHQVERRFIRPVEAAHGVHPRLPGEALAFDIDATVGLNPQMRAHLVCDLNGSRLRAEFADGTCLVRHGADVRIAPGEAPSDYPYADALAWAQLACAPLRLRDQSVKLRWIGEMPCREATCPAVEFTDHAVLSRGDPLTGLIYAHPETGQITAIAHTGMDESCAITYEHTLRVAEVVLADRWAYWPWSRETGPRGDYTGLVTLSNIAFVQPDEATFAAAPGAARLP